jgi:hypothetical protein
MSDNLKYTAAESLVECVIKSLGKKVFLKAVEKVCGNLKGSKRKTRSKHTIPAEHQCCARIRGERTGIKAGKFVLYDNVKCARKLESQLLCAIHENELKKKGQLKYGIFGESLTELQKKVFGDV